MTAQCMQFMSNYYFLLFIICITVTSRGTSQDCSSILRDSASAQTGSALEVFNSITMSAENINVLLEELYCYKPQYCITADLPSTFAAYSPSHMGKIWCRCKHFSVVLSIYSWMQLQQFNTAVVSGYISPQVNTCKTDPAPEGITSQ